MIIAIFAVTLFTLLTLGVVLWVLHIRDIFLTSRLLGLSTAIRSDSVGGVGISILCPSPTNIDVVVNRLDSLYPLSEVVVVVDSGRQSNLLSQLKIHYQLTLRSAEGCEIYRSRNRCYSRLVVVVTDSCNDAASLYDLAAANALFDYLLCTPSNGYLFPFAVGRIAEMVATEPLCKVDYLTTSDSSLYLVSRAKWREYGDFNTLLSACKTTTPLHIAEPLMLQDISEKDYSLLIERSRYNFWDFLALNIMKSRKKVLPLQKP